MNFSAFTAGFGLGILALAFIQTEEGQSTIRSIRKAITDMDKAANSTSEKENNDGHDEHENG